MDHNTTAITYNWILNTTEIEALLTKLCFREQVIQYVCEAAQRVARSDEVMDFLDFCNSWQEIIKQQSARGYSASWQTLAVISAFPEAIEKHRALGVPWEITQSTLFDFDRRMEENYQRKGKWEFNSLSWMRNHVSGRFFQIGRLQYIPGPYGYAFRVYRDAKTAAIIPLALPGLHCTAEGWPCNADSQVSFETTCEIGKDGITGYPATKNGAIACQPIKIAAGSALLIDEHSTVLNIHIPWGEKLEPQKCVESLRKAKEFFEKYFSHIHVSAFCTATWLLDPELAKVLLPTSNIVGFGRLFRPMALRTGNDTQLLERVFESDRWENCQAVTSLQKAVLQHHRSGGEFRTTAGFILPEDIIPLH